MTDWTSRFMELSRLVATWSKDPRTKVGAVIVDWRRRVMGLGFNGFPRGVHDYEERYAERSVKHRLVVHAEANAILNSAHTASCTLYCTKAPCSECVKLLVQAGIQKVVCPPWDTEGTWAADAEFAKQMLAEADVVVFHPD